MAYFEGTKCFEKEFLWVLSLSKAEGRVIYQELRQGKRVVGA